PTTTALYTLSLHDALPICSMISRPLYLPSPVTQPIPPSCKTAGGGSMSLAAIFRTSEAESTIRPDRRPLNSTTRIRFLRFAAVRSEEHTSELQSPYDLVCR